MRLFGLVSLFTLVFVLLSCSPRTSSDVGDVGGASSNVVCRPAAEGVPQTYDLDTPVLRWWAASPYNPESPCYLAVGQVRSPEPVVNVRQRHGGNIQAAINALPQGGGTLLFEPGTYAGDWKLTGRSNVHLVSEGGAVFTGSGTVSGCAEAEDYNTIVTCSRQARAPVCLACVTTGRAENIYFKNITFDGGDSLVQALRLSAAKRVLFEGVTFRNFRDPGTNHPGLISGAVNLDDVWIRASTFTGRGRWAVYLDGLHAGGVVESRIENTFGAGGILLLTNQDMNLDLDNDRRFTLGELRQTNHVVVAFNTFGAQSTGATLGTAVQLTGRESLVYKNKALGPLLELVGLEGKCDAVNPGANIRMVYEGVYVMENEAASVNRLVRVSGFDDSCPILRNQMDIGRYVVRGNRVGGFFGSQPGLVAEAHQPLVGPSAVVGNTCSGGFCDDRVVQR